MRIAPEENKKKRDVTVEDMENKKQKRVNIEDFCRHATKIRNSLDGYM